MNGFYVIYFPYCCDKVSDTEAWEKNLFQLSLLAGTPSTMKEGMVTVAWGSWLHYIPSQEVDREEGWRAFHILGVSLCQLGIQDDGTMS